MSADTNPHELIAQWKKATRLADFLHSLGVKIVDPEPSDEMRQLMCEAAGLASIPSRAVVALASVMLQERRQQAELETIVRESPPVWDIRAPSVETIIDRIERETALIASPAHAPTDIIVRQHNTPGPCLLLARDLNREDRGWEVMFMANSDDEGRPLADGPGYDAAPSEVAAWVDRCWRSAKAGQSA